AQSNPESPHELRHHHAGPSRDQPRHERSRRPPRGQRRSPSRHPRAWLPPARAADHRQPPAAPPL
ncbi:MAG: hypothetical protein AVDCRST_MAG38-1653, partial [uncultured Solirubrobacteraceae bacterium]